jgi:pimeloyl-ACP methyl ester carboxylesterase
MNGRSAAMLCSMVFGCATATPEGGAAPEPSRAGDPDLDPPPGAAANARERDVEAGEVRLHIRVAGADRAGTTLLVANGGPESYEYIRGLDALGGPDLRVVYYDLRGVGPSTKPASGDYGLDAHVADVEAIRAALGTDRLDLLGHSFGSSVVAAFAAKHPDRVVTPLALTSDVQLRAFEKLGAYEESLVPLGLATDHPPEIAGDDCTARDRARERRYFADPRSPVVGMHGSRCYVEARKRSFDALEQADLTAIVASLRGPVLAVSCDRDPFGQEPYEQFVRALNGAKTTARTLSGCGHDPFLEAHPQIIALLRGWLASPGLDVPLRKARGSSSAGAALDAPPPSRRGPARSPGPPAASRWVARAQRVGDPARRSARTG